jgi:hypothetical protein
VVVVADDAIVASHDAAQSTRARRSYDWQHYIAAGAAQAGALRNGAPFAGPARAAAADCARILLQTPGR